ncbi:MAG: type IV secretion system DNA-binding domain-containing protein [Candidatus Levybacteria bacterium]|nr:type IV secretion system DNA-binding domain-containing protein [Candidatus Levybacteria bacterium]
MDVQKLRADYWSDKFWNYFLHLKENLLTGAQDSSLFIIFISVVSIFFLIYIVRRLLNIKKSLNEQSMLLELTPPSFTEQESYTTDQLFSIIHSLGSQQSFVDKILGKKTRFSLEIVSTQNLGIRYIIRTSPKQVNTLRKSLLSYLPHLGVKIVNEYLPQNTNNLKKYFYKILEFKLSKHFAFSLKKQSELAMHDPIAYITGMMTKLNTQDLISLQLVVTPIKAKGTKKISKLIGLNGDVIKYLRTPGLLKWILFNLYSAPHTKSPSEMEAVSLIDSKINQPLFETTIRLQMIFKNVEDLFERQQGFKSAFSTFSSNGYQGLSTIWHLNIKIVRKYLFFVFKKRLLSVTGNSILSISEISGIYHFPYTSMTNTENLVKSHSKTLAAPLSLKKGRKMDVTFGNNHYGGTTTQIGLTEEERETHMYIIGRTGSGKTTMMFSMAKRDIEEGRGMAFLDPHGDAADDLVSIIPENRINDLVFINPIDLKHPIGINLLELTPGLDEDEAELEKEVVAEGVISLFRKVFSREENTNAHRIEYVLRNAIYTAFTVEDRTIFTVYDLLNNPPFQKQVIAKLKDENLKNFWKFEFGRAGDYQVVKMVGGVTAKIGRFLFSPTAKRILEQKKSTINFSEIMDSGKIVICNLSQGKLGEDTSRLLGTTIMTKIQQATLKRANIKESDRKPFYLYIDEFQNFATQSFTKMLSEGRKYKLRVTIAEQTTSQQQDRNIVNVILANVTTVVCFRSANPIDEDLMLAQFSPYLTKGDISNLPKYNFYIKVSALEPEEPFSGETIYIPLKKDAKRIEKLVEASRKNYAIVYQKPIPHKDIQLDNEMQNVAENGKRQTISKTFIPDEEEEYIAGTGTR